jgi:putative SOS response-associated peptidase YedK
MCGRFTHKLTWEEIVRLYRITLDAAPHNLRPRFNGCPTDPIDTVTVRDGQREYGRMRWGLVPYWWSKPLKELRMATFNARAETVATKPVFREAFKRSRCLIPRIRLLRVAGHAERQATLVLHRARWFAGAHDRGHLERMEKPRDGRTVEVMRDDNHRTE